MNITTLVNIVGVLLFSIIGATIGILTGYIITGIISGIIIWLGIYLISGFTIVSPNEFLVIERLGNFLRVVKEGWTILCLPGLIDVVAPDNGRGDFKWHRADLYADEPDNKIDFKDGSAKVKMQVWYRVGESEADVKEWVYRVQDSPNRVEEIADGTARPLLQKETIDSASVNLQTISDSVRRDPEFIASLKEMGVELDPHKGVIITDIVLPKEIEESRQETIKGKREADRQSAQGGGYARAIRAIMREAQKEIEIRNEAGVVIKIIPGRKTSWAEAVAIYEKQRGLEVLQSKTGAINFVSPDLPGIMTSIGINQDPKK